MTNERKRRQSSSTLNGSQNTNSSKDEQFGQDNGLTFEEAVRRLDEAVNSLEGGQLPLDDALRIFEEGMRLAQQCQSMLDSAELRVQRLRRKDNDLENELETATFLLETFEIENE